MGKHIQQLADTKANINAIGAGNYKPQFLYFATDSPYEFAVGLSSGNLSTWVNPATIGTPLTVASSSANYLLISGGEISLKSLAIITTTTNTTSTSLSAALTLAGYTSGNLIFQNSDMLILTAATGGTQIWLHNGGTAGSTADFTQIETPNLSDAYIRALMSGAAPITYNSSTGAIGLNFQNALQNSGGNLVWGGALTADTTVSGAFNVLFNLGATKSVTLGAAAGASRFNVDGDMEVTDNTKGLILKNGSARWRVTVAADGSLTTTSI